VLIVKVARVERYTVVVVETFILMVPAGNGMVESTLTAPQKKYPPPLELGIVGNVALVALTH